MDFLLLLLGDELLGVGSITEQGVGATITEQGVGATIEELDEVEEVVELVDDDLFRFFECFLEDLGAYYFFSGLLDPSLVRQCFRPLEEEKVWLHA